MSKTCKQKEKVFLKALRKKGFKGGYVYICYSCAYNYEFHYNAINSIYNTHGLKPCILCDSEVLA